MTNLQNLSAHIWLRRSTSTEVHNFFLPYNYLFHNEVSILTTKPNLKKKLLIIRKDIRANERSLNFNNLKFFKTITKTRKEIVLAETDIKNSLNSWLKQIAQLIDPKGNVRVSRDKWIEWNNETIIHFVDPKDGKNRSTYHGETSYVFALTAGYLESGLWRVRIFKGNITTKVWHWLNFIYVDRTGCETQNANYIGQSCPLYFELH